MLEIPDADIEPAPEFRGQLRTDLIYGMGKVAGKFVVLPDMNKVLSLDCVAVIASMKRPETLAA